MIGGFPIPLPDELFYSICARWHHRLGTPRLTTLGRHAFGRGKITAAIDLPTYLDTFVQNLPPGHAYSVDCLIDQHTLLPWYALALPPERVLNIRAGMASDRRAWVTARSGISRSTIPILLFLRFCPHCVERDRRLYGAAYWHRVHQLSGVDVCPHHGVQLEQSSVIARRRTSRRAFIPAEQAVHTATPRCLSDNDSLHAIQRFVAEEALWILQQPQLIVGSRTLRERYLNIMAQHGLATYSGGNHLARLVQGVRKYYGASVLQALHCELDNDPESTWLARLVRNHGAAQHPLYHLLLIRFLGYSTAEFLSHTIRHEPFGAGPWPCLNRVSDHYGQLAIPTVQITYAETRERHPRGHFVCACGFGYVRTGPDNSEGAQFRIDHMISYGSVWEGALQQLWNDPFISVEQMRSLLGATPLTIHRHARRLGLPYPPPGKYVHSKRAQALTVEAQPNEI